MNNITEFGISIEDLNKIYTMKQSEYWRTFVEKVLKVWVYSASISLTNMDNTRESDLII